MKKPMKFCVKQRYYNQFVAEFAHTRANVKVVVPEPIEWML